MTRKRSVLLDIADLRRALRLEPCLYRRQTLNSQLQALLQSLYVY